MHGVRCQCNGLFELKRGEGRKRETDGHTENCKRATTKKETRKRTKLRNQSHIDATNNREMIVTNR